MVFELILMAFYFMLPAYFANMAPVIVKNRFKNLAAPIDFNKKFNKKPILGKHKTWRGLIFGIIFAITISYIQYLFFKNNYFTEISLINYSNWLIFGLLIGLGTALGDIIESFIKRRLNYKSGQKFIPFDQLDFVIGTLILTSALIRLEFLLILIILIVSFVLDVIINHLSFYLKIRDEKW